MGKVLDSAICPRCRGPLEEASRRGFDCGACGQAYPRLGSVRVLLPEATRQIEVWRQQLGLVLHHASETIRALAVQSSAPDLAATTRTRLQALARSIAEQAADVAQIVGPALGDPLLPEEGVGLPRGAADYMSCLFRDWAWSEGRDPENERSLASIRRIIGDRASGRTLVLGAGGCRLAYDLHLERSGNETAVVDLDPFLLVVAEAIVRGAPVALTETSGNAPEPDSVSRRWALSPPAGPIGPDEFHFVLADGTAPPFADGAFETVVTPWFIDQVPTDLEALLGHLHRLLVPGGRWINHGPLIYRPDALPIARWYTRQEIFDLASRIGFKIGAWESASQAHLVSPLTGRGLIENVLTFEAVRA
jgi:SAM-dependent methyltransferase